MLRSVDQSRDGERSLPCRPSQDCIIAIRGYNFQEGQVIGRATSSSASTRPVLVLHGRGDEIWLSAGIGLQLDTLVAGDDRASHEPGELLRPFQVTTDIAPGAGSGVSDAAA